MSKGEIQSSPRRNVRCSRDDSSGDGFSGPGRLATLLILAVALVTFGGCSAIASGLGYTRKKSWQPDGLSLAIGYLLGGSILPGSGGGGGGGGDDDDDDLTPPIVLTTTPADGATTTDGQPSLTILFSEAMDPTTVTVNASDDDCATGSINLSWDNFASCIPMTAGDPVANGNKTEFTFTPAEVVDPAALYRIRVTTGARDSAGNPLAVEYLQTTGICIDTTGVCAPLVIATSPADGDDEIDLQPPITVIFNETMIPTTVTVNSSDDDCSVGSVNLSDDDFATCIPLTPGDPVANAYNTEFTITPLAPLTSGLLYRVRVKTDVQDADANPMPTEYLHTVGICVEESGGCAGL